jgi:hypothetical protein
MLEIYAEIWALPNRDYEGGVGDEDPKKQCDPLEGRVNNDE